jgi:Rieske Fe-S protein
MVDQDLTPLDPQNGEWDEKALSRRRILEAGFWLAAGAGVVATLGASFRYLVGTSLEPRKEHWVEVGQLEDLSPGEVHRVKYSLRAKDAWRTVEKTGAVYAMSDDGETYTVLDATCTHLGCLVRWKETEFQFACPCHSASFDRQGEVLSGPPPKPLLRLETRIENGVLEALV